MERGGDNIMGATSVSARRKSLAAFPGIAGMYWFIASEVALFGGLFAGVVYLRAVGPGLFPRAAVWSPLLVSLYTGLLALAAGSLWRAQKSDSLRARLLWIGASAVAGGAFVVFKLGDYIAHWQAGFRPDTGVFWASYYLCTGLHAGHVLAGVVGSLVVAAVQRREADDRSRAYLHVLRLYWTFVDVVWVSLLVLFPPGYTHFR